MKRYLILAGSIIGIIIDSIFAFIMIFGIYLIKSSIGIENLPSAFDLLGTIQICLGIASLALNAFCIPSYSCSHDDFVQKKKILIAALIMNGIIVILTILSLIQGGWDFLVFLIFAVSITVIILYVIDISKEKARAYAEEYYQDSLNESDYND